MAQPMPKVKTQAELDYEKLLAEQKAIAAREAARVAARTGGTGLTNPAPAPVTVAATPPRDSTTTGVATLTPSITRDVSGEEQAAAASPMLAKSEQIYQNQMNGVYRGDQAQVSAAMDRYRRQRDSMDRTKIGAGPSGGESYYNSQLNATGAKVLSQLRGETAGLASAFAGSQLGSPEQDSARQAMQLNANAIKRLDSANGVHYDRFTPQEQADKYNMMVGIGEGPAVFKSNEQRLAEEQARVQELTRSGRAAADATMSRMSRSTPASVGSKSEEYRQLVKDVGVKDARKVWGQTKVAEAQSAGQVRQQEVANAGAIDRVKAESEADTVKLRTAAGLPVSPTDVAKMQHEKSLAMMKIDSDETLDGLRRTDLATAQKYTKDVATFEQAVSLYRLANDANNIPASLWKAALDSAQKSFDSSTDALSRMEDGDKGRVTVEAARLRAEQVLAALIRERPKPKDLPLPQQSRF